MGTNTIATAIDGVSAVASAVNQYKTAMDGDLVPRVAGAPTDAGGSLGNSTYKYAKAHVESGYWSAGDIKAHHSYNGATPIGQGWMLCNGDLCVKAIYEVTHGVGSWDTYIGSSPLDGLYLPNLLDRYPMGAATTPQTGASTITGVGNSGSQVNITHNHQWYNATTAGAADQSFNGSGALLNLPAGPDKSAASTPSIPYKDEDNLLAMSNLYTSNGGSTNLDIKPDSLEVQYYIRII